MPPSLPSLIEVEASRHRIFRDHLLVEIPNLDEETLGDTLGGGARELSCGAHIAVRSAAKP